MISEIIKEAEPYLSGLAEWRGATGQRLQRSDKHDHVLQLGSCERALAYATLFFPEFIEVEGAIIFKDSYTQANWDEWKAAEYTIQQIETVCNHRHLWDIVGVTFNAEYQHEPNELFVALGKVLMIAWSLCLEKQFPDRRFIVKLNEQGDYGPVIYVRQEWH